MKTSIVVLLFALLTIASIASCSSAPAEEEHHGDRHVRFTCDALSGLGVADSACAVRCVAMNRGYHGGHCKGGVCHCRK
ncbi:defensin-1-like [Schistocerca piceifrons]|uniref:defensin-1-like n=1 Tax=Schistocerca piceifrons TaxID=274613 RepID=UPI001F5FA6FC|nr:defensin-1-like [Schistocerca piceifrons]XP_049950736.1 defensin-1-like [Schistocerca serialis cubense]